VVVVVGFDRAINASFYYLSTFYAFALYTNDCLDGCDFLNGLQTNVRAFRFFGTI
jgi:hypothetical protein